MLLSPTKPRPYERSSAIGSQRHQARSLNELLPLGRDHSDGSNIQSKS